MIRHVWASNHTCMHRHQQQHAERRVVIYSRIMTKTESNASLLREHMDEEWYRRMEDFYYKMHFCLQTAGPLVVTYLVSAPASDIPVLLLTLYLGHHQLGILCPLVRAHLNLTRTSDYWRNEFQDEIEWLTLFIMLIMCCHVSIQQVQDLWA